MPYKIIWQPDAVADLDEHVDYLLDKWSAAVVQEFEHNLKQALQKLQHDPLQFKIESIRKQIRRCRVDRYISLYYLVTEGAVDILYFQHGSRNPGRVNV